MRDTSWVISGASKIRFQTDVNRRIFSAITLKPDLISQKPPVPN
jgi:hypothetical protein